MTARTCTECGTSLAATAHPNRTTCGRDCKEAAYRRRQRDRRPKRPAKRPTPHPRPTLNHDGLAARLRKRERDIQDGWTDRR